MKRKGGKKKRERRQRKKEEAKKTGGWRDAERKRDAAPQTQVWSMRKPYPTSVTLSRNIFLNLLMTPQNPDIVVGMPEEHEKPKEPEITPEMIEAGGRAVRRILEQEYP